QAPFFGISVNQSRVRLPLKQSELSGNRRSFFQNIVAVNRGTNLATDMPTGLRSDTYRLCPVAFGKPENRVVWVYRVRVVVLDVEVVFEPLRTVWAHATVNIPSELVYCSAVLQSGKFDHLVSRDLATSPKFTKKGVALAFS